MPIDPLSPFFPPPISLAPDRPHRVERIDRNGRPGHKPEPRSKRRRAESETDDPGGDEHGISVEA